MGHGRGEGVSHTTTLRLILWDQLTHRLSALRDVDRRHDTVLMAEVWDEATSVRHHKQKLALIFAAMRHFAAELRAAGMAVDYVALDDPENSGSLTGEVERALARHRVQRLVMTEPTDWRLSTTVGQWRRTLGLPVEVREDDRFLCAGEEFARWAEGRRSLRMESFYRTMRRRTGWLMANDQPEGGRWNYDVENRRRLPPALRVPERLVFTPDAVTAEVLRLVGDRFAGHFGDLEPFAWGVTSAEARQALRHFVVTRLPQFGAYQDAMKVGGDVLFHAAISPYLNLGLLTAREVCHAALEAYRRGAAPLASVEGFVRQLLGWREYVRGVYRTHMPGYARSNFLQARRALPRFYWTGDTAMACLRHCLGATRRNAYAHHIQRLMVTGVFALLAGLAPREVEEWYLIVYADAHEWVELPNTHGMALYADGGVLATKPYAASGAYIDRMSDYCRGCAFDPKARDGAAACPFTVLYWHFLIAHESRLRGNPRLSLAYRNLARMGDDRRRRIVADATRFLKGLDGQRHGTP